MSAVTFTLPERSALLRAARKAADELNAEIIRFVELDGTGTAAKHNETLRNYAAEELQHLQSAVKKLWISSGE